MSDCKEEKKKCHLSIKSKTECENGKLLYWNSTHTIDATPHSQWLFASKANHTVVWLKKKITQISKNA